MIERSKSFSKSGTDIERIMEIQKYKVDEEQLRKMLKNKIKVPQSKLSQEESAINGFDKVTGRQKPSPFLIFNIKDAHTHLNYQNKKETVMPRTALLPVRKQKDERLSLLMAQSKKQGQQQSLRLQRHAKSCRRFTPSQEKQVSTARQLQNGRKTFHNIDFAKQTERPFDETIKKMTIKADKEFQLTRSNSVGTFSKKQCGDSLAKTDKIHSFGSYTKRDFLTEKKVRGAPEVSGINWYQVNPQKFKSNWKTVQQPKFQTVAKKALNRYDRDGPHWFAQLSYNPKRTQNPGKSHVEFLSQTQRKTNFVKSGYPIRLAI